MINKIPKIRFKNLLFDNGDYELIECPSWSTPDPLKMEINGKKYQALHYNFSSSDKSLSKDKKLITEKIYSKGEVVN